MIGRAAAVVQLARHLLTMGAAALIGSLLVALFIKETLPKERRQRFHLRTTLGNFGSLFRHKRVLSYMLASAFSFAGMFLSSAPGRSSTSN